MKKTLAVILGLLILTSASMGWAERTRPGQHKSKKGKHKGETRLDPYKNSKVRGAAGKATPDLNPQPLPPGVKSPPGQGGAGNQAK